MKTANPTSAFSIDPPSEENTRGAHDERAYLDLLDRLSRVSVTKHYDAYADIPWDDADYAIDPDDPRWIMSGFNPLGATRWYQEQPETVQSRIGLHMAATFMKIGSQFESVLKRGLLEFATRLPNRSPEFRYVYHEVIEEAHHSLMFQEFVNRSGFDIPGLPRAVQFGARRVAALGRRFPELFFMFVLGGEDPIDYQQREFVLSAGQDVHPLLRRISQIHVTEEARHLSFARAYLRRHVPELSALKLAMLRLRTPLILGQMSRFMMEPSPQIVRAYDIPKETLQQAYHKNAGHRQEVQNALAKIRELCTELRILAPPFDRIWVRLAIAPLPEAA